jgi:hypothetical protein
MSNNYLIVLFKNKIKRKIIKSYSTEKNALVKFKELIKKNDEVIFEKRVENACDVNFEIGLLTNKIKTQKSLFIVDSIGRNNPVNLENPDYVFLEIKPYRVEETVFDWQRQEKITIDRLLRLYCKKKDFKSIFTLHNKLCIQVELDVSLFSLKDSEESERLLDVLELYFRDNGRTDAMFIKDVSSAQRKWIYQTLEDKGFDKKRLYRLKTTFTKM